MHIRHLRLKCGPRAGRQASSQRNAINSFYLLPSSKQDTLSHVHTMKSYCIFLLSSFFAASEAFVLPSASSIPKTQLSAKTSSSRAEFLRDVAATSIASVIVSLPGMASADDTEDLSMPTAEEQKAQDVSKTKGNSSHPYKKKNPNSRRYKSLWN